MNYKEGPTKLCTCCGRFVPIDDNREFLPHNDLLAGKECLPKPQTIDQIIFWLEIGGYSVVRYPGFWNEYSYSVTLPNGVVFSLDIQRMRDHAIAVWWRYQLI